MAALTEAKDAATSGTEAAEQLQVQIDRLNQAANTATSRLALATTLAPGSTRIANAAGAADGVTAELRSALQLVGAGGREAGKALDLAEIQLGNALDVIASIQDNPFRRLSSLMVGAAAGTMVASFVGVNLFAAISDAGIPALQGTLGVVVTGIVVGLGSGPTHELVKSLQANKKARQLQPIDTRVLAPVQSPRAERPSTEVIGRNRNIIARVAPEEREGHPEGALGDIGVLVVATAPATELPPTFLRRTALIRSTD